MKFNLRTLSHALRCAILPVATLPVAALILSGCGAGSVSTPASFQGAALTGHVLGGQQPVTSAVISLYAAGLTGTGTGATSLLTTAVRTDLLGDFTITGDYTCPSPTSQMYIVARGGNPGLSGRVDNQASVMMTALGDCINLTPSTNITINEVTTAAAAWALQQFAPATGGSGAIFGASPTNATGLRNAFLVANNLVNTSTGSAGGAGLPAGAALEADKLYTLADILSVCINSSGGATCSPLFAATPGATAPSNTLDAALAIVRNPATNVAGIFNTSNAQGPFQPTLATAPNDWTMTISYIGGGVYAPTALGIDSTGSIWAADYYGGHASKLSAAGIPAAANGFADSHLVESYGLAIDGQDSAWITVEEDSGVNSNDGAITKFASNGTLLSGSGFYAGGVYYPYAIAADTNGNVWIADFGRSSATLLDTNGNSLSGPAGFTPTGLSFPTSVALDNFHNAWFGAQGVSVEIAPSGAANSPYSCCRGPAGIALDPSANVWIADYAGNALVQLTAGGTLERTLTGTGGIDHPESITTDAAGQVWATNFRGNSISGFASGSTPITPATGFGVDPGLSQPFGIAVDASGNLWVSNFALNSLTQFVGLAAPTKTPRLGLPTAP